MWMCGSFTSSMDLSEGWQQTAGQKVGMPDCGSGCAGCRALAGWQGALQWWRAGYGQQLITHSEDCTQKTLRFPKLKTDTCRWYVVSNSERFLVAVTSLAVLCFLSQEPDRKATCRWGFCPARHGSVPSELHGADFAASVQSRHPFSAWLYWRLWRGTSFARR